MTNAGSPANAMSKVPTMTVDTAKPITRCLSRLVLSLVAALSMGFIAPPAGGDTQAHAMAVHALALRAAAVDGAGAEALALIPGGGPMEQRHALWSPFFENTVVALGRLRSPVPAALYYNPLLDAALIARWETQEGGYRIASIRALPGERLSDPDAEVSPQPEWMTMSVEGGPVAALAGIAAARLDAFRRDHPANARAGSPDPFTFAAAAAQAQSVLPRLRWNAEQRARWLSGADAWLHPTLAAIEEALSAGDPALVMAAAPATDTATAEVISDLPAGLAPRLVLDMVLDTGEDGRLLIGSLPGDGDVYFLVLCRLNGDACPLHRVVMVSLSEWRNSDDRPEEGG